MSERAECGRHIGCDAPGCRNEPVIAWLDYWIPWAEFLCHLHALPYMPSVKAITFCAFAFSGCPDDVKIAVRARLAEVRAFERAEYGSATTSSDTTWVLEDQEEMSR
jgi:hypothetical protein